MSPPKTEIPIAGRMPSTEQAAGRAEGVSAASGTHSDPAALESSASPPPPAGQH